MSERVCQETEVHVPVVGFGEHGVRTNSSFLEFDHETLIQDQQRSDPI
jgi:hypothetical protein